MANFYVISISQIRSNRWSSGSNRKHGEMKNKKLLYRMTKGSHIDHNSTSFVTNKHESSFELLKYGKIGMK